MSNPFGPLTNADLLPHGPLRRIGTHALLRETVDSTNLLLLAQAADLPDGTIASAEFQTAGRGRLGRRWVAPRGASLLLSVLLHEAEPATLTSTITLMTAVAACEAIEQLTDCTPRLRWPNDVIIGRRKVGGVLAESRAIPGRRAVIAGIGLNCLQHAAHFPAELAGRATSLDLESTEPVHRGPLAARLLECLDAWVANYDRYATEIRRAWHARCADFGARLTLVHDGQQFEGTALDIADNADLILQLDQGGRRHFAATTTTRIP